MPKYTLAVLSTRGPHKSQYASQHLVQLYSTGLRGLNYGARATAMPSEHSPKCSLLTSDNNSRLHGTVRDMRWKNTSSSTRGVVFVGESYPETWLLVVNQGPCPTAPNPGIYTVDPISPVRKPTTWHMRTPELPVTSGDPTVHVRLCSQQRNVQSWPARGQSYTRRGLIISPQPSYTAKGNNSRLSPPPANSCSVEARHAVHLFWNLAERILVRPATWRVGISGSVTPHVKCAKRMLVPWERDSYWHRISTYLTYNQNKLTSSSSRNSNKRITIDFCTLTCTYLTT
jgi:hypothetical protein